MTNKEFEKSAEKAKEVEEKLKEQNEEKQMISNKERYSRYTRLISLMIKCMLDNKMIY